MKKLLASSSSGGLTFMHSVIEQYSLDVDAILKSCGINSNELNNIYKRIPEQRCSDYINLMIKETSPVVAIKACEHLNPAIFNSFGTGLLFSSSLRDFCLRYSTGFAFITSLIDVDFIEDESQSYLTIKETVDLNSVNSNFYSDVFSALTIKLLKLSIGPNFKAKKICLTWTPKEDILQDYIDYFDCEIEFSANKTMVLFDNAELDIEFPWANEELAEKSDKMVFEFLQRSYDFDLTSKVTTIVTELLAQGKCNKLNVAKICGMSESTLQNKLNNEDTNFQEIVDNLRKKSAVQLIRDNSTNLEQISFKLGYYSYSNFSRAFKAWFGLTPLEYKNSQIDSYALAG
ncbi:helix-turn-helix domain-containing protein [Thalassotalea fonticola]|uniref:Helix-turn-helix domain-containing protein n=1 Tax=Thalassotalea fonticola TaxID=3065649 RepID=A0ABZ0GRY5_9GAMM|nr:helix-turn-helix domain-containing protein [Colwelliaceae bacterium S1-1]